MKNFSGFKRFLALTLCIVMLCAFVPAQASAWSYQGSGNAYASGGLWSWLGDLWDWLFGGGDEPSDPDDSLEFNLVEDSTTVSSGTYLRASTYAVSSNDIVIDGRTIKYFPVTLFNYDDRYNNALHQIEAEANQSLTQWNGIYFGGNGLGANVSDSDSYAYIPSDTTYREASVEYRPNGDYNEYINSGYYVFVDGDYKLITGLSCEGSGWPFNRVYTWTITCDDDSNVTRTGPTITLFRTGSVTITASYASYNKWTGNGGSSGNRTYSGLVESNLDANKNIVFKHPEAGIFTLDATNKDVYTGVELPFVYADNTYTFDAEQFAAYFHTDETQGTSATPASNGRLYYSTTQQYHGLGNAVQDGSNNGWFPFVDGTNISTDTADTYFFGMSATIPFTMTANGRLKANDDTSTPITFNFSGDDDVWVFIDGVLVLDIGGVHNRLNGSINFAENTWTITKPSTNGGGGIGDYNDSSLSGTLFNDGDTVGILGIDRQTFAAKDSHDLTIFYLERGAGSSNCKIEFNLPMKDYVSVTKRATHSKTDVGEVTPLTSQEQAMVDAADFGFTLYKNDSPVANTNYNLINAKGQYVETRSTDANGHFTLKNGQTAKFIGEIATDGNNYYVVEDEKSGYVTPKYTYTATAAGGATQVADSESWKSMTVNANGSDEAEDNVQFVCTNYLNANLPNPSLFPEPDKIVIDYGLPVIIPDVLANDTWKGESIELSSVTSGNYGTAVKNDDGTITYTLTQRLDAVDVLTYTVTVTGTGNSGDEVTTETLIQTGTIYIIPATSMYYEENFGGLITYSSGTSWAGWTPSGTATNTYQESGVVGTVDDSPYGSDVAYTDDATDSNGTVMSTDTTNYYAYFRYEFIGTGTAFFARLGANTGYLRIVLDKRNQTDTGWETERTIYRDTKVMNNAGTFYTFYNVPVYDVSDLPFGRYRLTVTVVKEGYPTGTEGGAGTKFYLDGVRVYNPLSSSDANYAIATAAYATDGESNNTTVTIRDKIIIDGVDNDGFISFTDTNGAINMSQYQSIGPKNELYLIGNETTSQTITFSLDAASWDASAGKVYIGIKAPQGSGTVRIGSTILNIGHAADCYYDISNLGTISQQTIGGETINVITFTITATSGIISLTRLRVTGIPNFVIISSPDVEA